MTDYWHITWATHNSRISEKARLYGKSIGKPVWLELEGEKLVTKTIYEIALMDGLKIHAFNICGDHVHLILESDFEKIQRIIQKLKAVSARTHNIWAGYTVLSNESSTDCKGTQFHLWARKYSIISIKSESQYWNTLKYIVNNRKKHGLPDNRDLNLIIFLMTKEQTGAESYLDWMNAIENTIPNLTPEEIAVVEGV